MTKILQILCVSLVASQSFASLKVHEWGTFTSLLGSNGISQHGMYHEDEVLPDFVHGFGEAINDSPAWSLASPTPVPTAKPYPRPCRGKGCMPMAFLSQNQVTQKMETPVIYFYSDKSQTVDVNVKFPQGVVSQTFPAPIATSPNSNDEPVLANGNTTFRVEVISPSATGFAEKHIPAVPAGNIYGHAREVPSNIVRAGREYEKFIFYRGLGRFQPRFDLKSEGGAITIKNSPQNISAAYLLHVDQRVIARKIGPIGPNEVVNFPARMIEHMKSFSSDGGLFDESALKRSLRLELIRSGLTTFEANSMIATWSHGYFKVPGLRILYVLANSEVESVLPMVVTPKPSELVRTFVGRIEVLTDTEEKRILTEILKAGSSFKPESLGRFAEPILRRVFQVYLEQRQHRPNPQIVRMFEKLISSISVTEATAAVH